MAVNLRFPGINRRFKSTVTDQDDAPRGVPGFSAYETSNQSVIYSAWHLDEKEIQEVLRTGTVWVAQITRGAMPNPMFVGSRSWVLKHGIDFGGMWGGTQDVRYQMPPIRREAPKPQSNDGHEPA
jgi:hypothetical protein